MAITFSRMSRHVVSVDDMTREDLQIIREQPMTITIGTKTLVIDELDTSLHTLLVRELIRLFHCPDINTGGAQLIFTTHDTSLLDAPDLFRRDQVWFVEKDRDQTSALVSLSEFSPRKNEALERGYLMGRYGGVPFLDKTLGLQH